MPPKPRCYQIVTGVELPQELVHLKTWFFGANPLDNRIRGFLLRNVAARKSNREASNDAHPKSETKGLSMITQYAFLRASLPLALSACPVFARDDNTELAAAKSDNATESLSADSLPQSFPCRWRRPAIRPTRCASFGPSSGTVVGNRALELRDSILRLRASVNLNSNEFAVLRSSGAAGAVQYHSTVAAITARLQNGTTRGNPILLRQWEEANASLDEVTSSLTRLNSLETAVDADASMASYLLEFRSGGVPAVRRG